MSDAEAEAEEKERGGVEDRLDDLVERAETATEGLREHVDDPDADLDELRERFEDGDEGDSEEAMEYVRDLLEVADELEDVIETIDLSDLPEAIDFEKIPELVEADEIPEALGDGDEDLGDAVKFRKLLKVIDLSDLWGAADVRSLWKEKRELEDEVDDVTGDEGGDDEGMMDGLTDDDDEEMLDDVDWEMPDFDGIEDYDPESAENAIQMKMMDGVEEMRGALLEAHDKLKTVREENRDRMARQDNSTNSRNPTAVSTMPTGDRKDIGSATRFSTVPRETRHSSAPNKGHIYGNRFDREDNDE